MTCCCMGPQNGDPLCPCQMGAVNAAKSTFHAGIPERRVVYAWEDDIVLIDVVELQLDADSLGLWIGFKSAADRDRAMRRFRVDPSVSETAPIPAAFRDRGEAP